MDHQHHDPHHHEVILPLRLAAEPYAKQSLSSSSVALSVHKDLAILVDDRGVLALASETLLQRHELLPLLPPQVQPQFHSTAIVLLIRDSSSGNSCRWHVLAESQQEPTILDEPSVASACTQLIQSQSVQSNIACAQWITTAIHKYYAQQILEPSVRGFLSVLEKQFSQSNLYIFELLQNAVDDGATSVRFQAANNALTMTHNGRQFTPLDVLGLSSVGLSTKSRQGKRTVGFMGVGFKAVYKRYAKVTIDDGQYAFSYQEPSNNSNQRGYGWVMLPRWQTPQHNATPGCHFSLQQPRGGFKAVLSDLAVLPKTAPPLLGRAALLKQEQPPSTTTNEWILDWNGTVHTVQRTQLQRYNAQDMSEVVIVKITKPDGSTRTNAWLFVTHEYTPSRQAMESYQRHTKRSPTGTEQVCGFIPLTSATTIASNFSGVVHSVLPTKIKLPIPLNLQGSFLLSVDRQQVQDLSDNAWNMNILLKLPDVIAIVFRWAAHKQVTDYTGIAKLLPLPSNNALMTQLLNQSISLDPLKQVLHTDPTIPVAMPRTEEQEPNDNPPSTVETAYYQGAKSIWVPPVFHSLLEPDFLRGWLGKRPVRTDAFGKEGAYHPLFLHITEGIEPVLRHRIRHLGEELQLPTRGVTSSAVDVLVKTMAAIGLAAAEEAKSAALEATTRDASNNTTTTPVAGPKLPPQSNVWPLFVDEHGGLATIDQIILHAQDMATVPPDLMPLLRPYFIKNEVSTATSSYKGGRPQKKRKMNQRKVLRRLHPLLERAICDIEAGRTPDDAAMDTQHNEIASGIASFLEQVRAENPKQVVDVGTAVSRLLESYSTRPTLSEDHVETVVTLTKYALETNNHSILAFVLVDSKGSTKIVPASKAYLGKVYDDSGMGADLESFAGSKLDFLSSAYSKVVPTKPLRRKFVDLVTLAGIQTRPSVSISAVLDVEKEKRLLSEAVLPKLPGNKLPALRNKPTKGEVKLPYDLGVVMNRRRCSLLDAELAAEWESLVNRMTPESAQGFIALLLSMPVEDAAEVTKKSVPAAALCIQGQSEPSQGATSIANGAISGNRCSIRIPSVAAVPLRRRLYFLPPGQPGAKAVDISEARIIRQLMALKWLPCTLPSDPSGGPVLLRPEEALLEGDSSRPEMPVVTLPPAMKRRLQESPIAKTMTFGTRAPPPPVDELCALAKEAGMLLSSLDIDKARVASLADKMVSLWFSIVRAHLREGLSPSDMSKLRALCKNSYCIPVRRVIDAPIDSDWIVQRHRCVKILEGGSGPTNGKKDDVKYLTISSFVASDFMCDFHHSRHNPFFSNPSISAAMQTLSGIPEATIVHPESLARASGMFIQYCCNAEPVIPNRLSPLRASFSFAMKWCIATPSERSKVKQQMKVWVRHGPGIGSKALRRGWVSINDGKVQPVLDDSRVRSALLAPEMGIQLLGILNHTDNETECPNSRILAKIDSEILQYLGIWRLSDKLFTVKTRAKGSGQLVASAPSRLQLVFALLKSMMLEHTSGNETLDSQQASNSFLSMAYEPPLMIRHESLSREFKGPNMDSPSLTPMYAVMGRAPKFTKDRCILVAGDSDDYSMELEEVVLNHVGARTGTASSQSKRWRAAVRLLSHLENEHSFDKFVKRDFSNDDATDAWRKLGRRRSVFQQLHEAEAAKDSKLLRKALMEAEEVCDDDPDGGEAELSSPRDLLQKLEETERSRVLGELEEAMQQTDHTKLRISLVLAEKVCKNSDPDVLKNARERLSALERDNKPQLKSSENDGAFTEEQSIAGMGRGRGRTLPAWITSKDGPELASVKSEVKQDDLDANEDGMAAEMVANDANPAFDSTPTEGRGRGRGRTLPAWMTSNGETTETVPPQVDPVSSDQHLQGIGQGRGLTLPAWVTSKDETPENLAPQVTDSASSDLQSSKPPQLTIGAGMGRGRGRTLPAWMTSGDGPQQATDQIVENPPPETASQDDPEFKAEAKSILSTILSNDNSSGDKEPHGTAEAEDENARLSSAPAFNRDEVLASGRGRGRTLPAWMTQDTASGSKRALPADKSEPGLENIHKRARTEAGFQYSVRVRMDPAAEPDFLKWVQSTIQQEADKRGGSATVQNSQFED